MKKTLTALLVMILVGTAFTGLAAAHGPQSMMGRGYNRNFSSNSQGRYNNEYNRIELSDEQINEIANLRDEFYDESQNLRNELRDLNREARNLEFQGAAYSEIAKVEDRIEDLFEELDAKRAAHQKKIEAVLTQEQLEMIEDNRRNYEDRFQGRYNNEFGPRSHMGFGRNGFSNRGFGHHNGYGMMGGHGMMNGYGMMGGYGGYGMMNGHGMMRGYNFGSDYRSNRSNRSFGFGAGWCH